MSSDINDKRTKDEFKKITFSKYKKGLAKNQLTKCLYESKLEESCYWCAEFICSGHYVDLWDIIIIFSSKYINLGNPKLSIYLELRYENFKNIVSNGYVDNELAMRNNHKIRELFCEIVCVLCYSDKKPTFSTLPIKHYDFNISAISDKLMAPSIHYANIVFLKGDPKELFIAINELAFHLSKESNNTLYSYFWVDWILEYDSTCRKKKDIPKCERRSFAPVEDKLQMDIVWIIWNLLIEKSINHKICNRLILTLMKLFSIRYTPGSKKRRKYIIYNSINLIIENVNYNIEIIRKNRNVKELINKLPVIYKQIKKSEVSPETDYLFNNIEKKSNLDKTVEKLEKLNSMMGDV